MTDIADRIAIQDILYQHSRGLDRLDAALLKQCYWDNAEVDYGAFKGPAQQFSELVIPALEEQYKLTRHALSNTLIDISGHVAKVESLVDAAHLLPAADEEFLFAGRYLDALEKRGDKWKMLRRMVVVDWCSRRPLVDESDSEAFEALSKGGHGNDDPLYPFLIGEMA